MNTSRQNREGRHPRTLLLFTLAALLAVLAPMASMAQQSHEDIDQAQVDRMIFHNLLNTSLEQSQGYLSNSYFALDPGWAGELTREESVAVFHDEYESLIAMPLGFAGDNLTALNTSINEAVRTLEALSGVADSVEYLEMVIAPFKEVRDNLTLHLAMHEHLLGSLNHLVSMNTAPSSLTEMETAHLLSELARLAAQLEDLRLVHSDIEENLAGIEALPLDGGKDIAGLPSETTQTLALLKDQYGLYENILERFTFELNLEEPMLVVETAKTGFFLDERIEGSGLFITGLLSSSPVEVRIFLNDRLLTSVSTDVRGFFTFSAAIPLDSPLGESPLTGRTTYNSTDHESNPVLVTVARIPAVIHTWAEYPDTAPGSRQTVSVSLRDHLGSPIGSALINIELDRSDHQLTTSAQGVAEHGFSTAGLKNGYHGYTASFAGTAVYEKTERSGSFRINVETMLVIDGIDGKNTAGEELIAAGTFKTAEGGDINGQEVRLLVNGRPAGAVLCTNGEFRIPFGIPDPGVYGITAECTPADPGLRNATSETVQLEIKDRGDGDKGLLGSLLSRLAGLWPVITAIVILLILGSITVLFLYRRRGQRGGGRKGAAKGRRHGRRGVKPGAPAKKAPVKPLVPAPAGGEKTAKPPLSIVDISLLSTEQKAIVHQYQRYMVLVNGRYEIDTGSLTPNEIREAAVAKGMPREPAQRITDIFNRAFYTTHGMTPSDIDTMVDSVDDISGGGRQ